MFSELSITSNFSFLTGASHPEEYMRRAASMGMQAIAIADENSVAGIVRAHTEARDIARRVAERQAWDAAHSPIGPPAPQQAPPSPLFTATPRLIPAARLVFTDGISVTTIAQTRAGWASLCRLISKGRLRAEKGECTLHLADLTQRGTEGLALLVHVPDAPDAEWHGHRPPPAGLS